MLGKLMLNETGIVLVIMKFIVQWRRQINEQMQYHVGIAGEWTQYMTCRIAGQESLDSCNFGSKCRLYFLLYVASSGW